MEGQGTTIGWGKAQEEAKQICLERGIDLTKKRLLVFAALLQAAPKPLSAYDIIDSMRAAGEANMQPISVYRMLEALIDRHLVHRLSSSQKFLACSHLVCDHEHELPQFLICNRCQSVREVGISKATIESLRASVAKANFCLSGPQLELHGVCENCKSPEDACT
jgi:Fur family zinc uptake transcriptional regulator